MIYIIFLSFFIFAAFFDVKNNQFILKKVLAFFLVISAIIFFGLRYYTGADWHDYIIYFNNVTWDDTRYQFGYKILNIICKSIINNYFFVQFIASSIFICAISKFFISYSRWSFVCIFLSLVLYFSTLFMAQVRQSLAIAIILFGSKFLFEKKNILFVISVLIASLFHITALFSLTLFFLKIPFSRRIRLILFASSFILLKFPELIFLSIESLGKVSKTIGSVSAHYLTGIYAKGAGVSSGVYFYAKCFLVLIILIFYKPKTVIDNFAMNALVFSNFLNVGTLCFVIIERLESYIGLYAILGYVKFFEISFLSKNKNIFYMTFFLFILFFSLPFVKDRLSTGINRNGRSAQYQYIPYYNVFMHPENANLRKDWNEK